MEVELQSYVLDPLQVVHKAFFRSLEENKDLRGDWGIRRIFEEKFTNNWNLVSKLVKNIESYFRFPLLMRSPQRISLQEVL
jgi:hypothetical protein